MKAASSCSDLLAGQERSVKELAGQLNLKEPTVSHHLARLQELGLVRMRPEGTTHRYQLQAATLHRLSRDLFTPTRVASIADGGGGRELGAQDSAHLFRR